MLRSGFTLVAAEAAALFAAEALAGLVRAQR